MEVNHRVAFVHLGDSYGAVEEKPVMRACVGVVVVETAGVETDTAGSTWV